MSFSLEKQTDIFSYLMSDVIYFPSVSITTGHSNYYHTAVTNCGYYHKRHNTCPVLLSRFDKISGSKCTVLTNQSLQQVISY